MSSISNNKDMEEKQVTLKITTDLYYTAEFLRELAKAIEGGGKLTEYETYRGMAEIEWPEED